MKRLIFLVTLLTLTLTACSSGVYDKAFTASGDGTNELELNETSQFRPNDDLNVVVRLSSHDNDVVVKATFYDSNNAVVGNPLSVTAGENVGTVVLGLDWEQWSEQFNGELWVEGTWNVKIEVDNEEVEKLEFRIGGSR